MKSLTGFKAYDIRGKLGEELDEDIARRIGRACGQFLQPRTMVVGSDVRPTSASLKAALVDGLRDSGSDVTDIGMVGTEEVYHGTRHLQADGGVIVTASHNPINYNGMKLVREEARPISGDTGLKEIRALAEADAFPPADPAKRGAYSETSTRDAYVDHLLGYIKPEELKPMRLVVNPGNGNAGPVIDVMEQRFAALKVPVEFIRVHHEPDGRFPNGIPNPLLPENRPATADQVRATGADMGVAWDGDFDRCFLFDENGSFIEGYYLVGLLAQAFLSNHPGSRIVHDPRLTWNTVDLVTCGGGVPVQSKTGHAFIKERMRQEDAVYGGEMSAHHYFRDFGYCDSGMIPWLLVAEMMSRRQVKLSRMMAQRMEAYPISGEINMKLEDPAAALSGIRAQYADQAVKVEEVDGLSMEMKDWRFNLRSSNTEPLVRLNVESRGDARLMQARTDEILNLLKKLS